MKQGWEIKKLGEVCDFQNGFAFQSKSYKESGLPILRITNIQNDEIDTKELVYFDTKDYKVNLDRFKVYQGDLLIAMSGATTGKLGINNSETVFYLNQRVGKFIPKKFLNKAFLYYFLTTKVEESLRIAAGAAQPNLSTEQINNFEIPLPPLPEQQRIVSILDEAFAAIAKAKANAEQNLKNAKELFESYLQGVFDPSTRLGQGKGDGWEEKKLGEVFEIKPPKKEAKAKLSDNDLVSFLPMEDLGVCENEIKPEKEKPLKDVAGSYTYFAENDVLIAKITPCFENGKLGVAKNLTNGVGFGSSEYIVFRCPENIVPEFLFYFLSRESLREEGKKYMSGAVGHKRVSKDWIENYLFSFPKSKEAQQTIVRQLDALRAETQKLEAVYQKKIDDLEELKKSVLRKAFAGEL